MIYMYFKFCFFLAGQLFLPVGKNMPSKKMRKKKGHIYLNSVHFSVVQHDLHEAGLRYAFKSRATSVISSTVLMTVEAVL